MSSKAWQHPYVNVFKHLKLEEWRKASKEGDVTTYMDKTLKCSVFRIRGSIPASNYILLPRTSSQSLGLTGRYLYLLFRPSPSKHFVVHVDIASEEGQVIRVSFSNLFKEFKSTATWLQFPFLCGAASGLVGPAPASVRWTCLMMDMRYVLSVYLNKTHSHLKSIKLCSNMTVKNLMTSDLLLDPEGTAPMPREMCFPVPKGSSWHQLYDYIRFPTDGVKMPFDSIQKGLTNQTPSECYKCTVALPNDTLSISALLVLQKLQPDPILKLSRIIGFGGATLKCAVWANDGEEVVYPCHAIIVSMKISSGQQRFFIGHTDKVSALALNTVSSLLASAQTGTHCLIRLWSYSKGQCLTMIKTHAHSLNTLSFSYSGGVLCGVGKDSHNKTMVVVWNTQRATKGGVVTIMAKAHTDVDVQTMKIAFFDDTRMVSCGVGNVRLWRVRGGSLRSCPVNLGQYHSLEFTDLAFEEGHAPDRQPDDRTLFASSKSGHILEIDYISVAIKNVRRLLPSQQNHSHRREKQTFSTGPGIAVNSISVCGAFCATGSEDGFLRLWPLDFSSVLLEAEHEGPVSLVSVSADGMSVLAATSTGNLGYLDVNSRGYRTLMRSHTNTVLGFSVDGIRRQITTASKDCTVRVWAMDSMQQLYDFVSDEDNDAPCSVVFHPSLPVFACGSNSGTVRVFDIPESSLLAQHRQHRGAVVGLVFSPDGEHLYSAGSLGYLALYNAFQPEYPILRVLGNVVAQGADRGPDALVVSSDSRCLAFVGPTEYTMLTCELHTSFFTSLQIKLFRVEIFLKSSTTLDSALKVCFAPSSLSHLLITTSSNKILWINRSTGRLLREVSEVHKHQCASLAVSEDGCFLLTAGHNAVKVWDYNMKLDVNSQVFIGHSQPITQVSFTPDQMGVVSVGDAIFFWDFLAQPHQEPSFLAEQEKTEFNEMLSNGMPRKEAPRPSSSLPVLDVSSIQKTRHGGDAVTPPPGQEGLSLKAVIGYNGNGRSNMVWNPDTGLFVYSCGCVVVVENLHTGSQKHWHGHSEEISTLAVTHDAQMVASASGGGASSKSLICIWNVQDGSRRNSISYHKGSVQRLAFSRDDLYFLSVGDFQESVVALWSTRSFELLCAVSVSVPLHEAAFCPSSASQLAFTGSSTVFFCTIHTHGRGAELQVQKVAVPERIGEAEVTSLCYNTNSILYTGTNRGLVCVWDTNTLRCFLTWEADEGEIGMLVCRGNRLVTGSNSKKLRLWSVGAVQNARPSNSERTTHQNRNSQVLLEQEMLLDGTVVSAAFDDVMDMGIVGTTAGTLWYINWVDNTSIRLISGHKSKVNGVVCSPDERHFATCGQDGSVRVWALPSNELLVQFQVLNQSCECVCWSRPLQPCESGGTGGGVCVAGGYSDGSVRVFNVESAEMELKLLPHCSAVAGQVLLSGGKDGVVTVSSPFTGVTSRHHCVSCLEFGLEGNELWLAVSLDRRVSIWAADWAKDKCELLDWLTFPAPSSPEVITANLPPSLAAFSPTERGVVVYTGYSTEREMTFYCLKKKQELRTVSLTDWALSLSLCFKERLLAVGSNKRVLKLIDSSSGRFQGFTWHSDSVHLCSFSPSGTQLFTTAHNEVFLWTLRGL
uniref:WD repeat domain 90 n=1 Tax=Astyanax mexicanus TaxID=7994 RepID=A0A8B9L481_ASTMX